MLGTAQAYVADPLATEMGLQADQGTTGADLMNILGYHATQQTGLQLFYNSVQADANDGNPIAVVGRGVLNLAGNALEGAQGLASYVGGSGWIGTNPFTGVQETGVQAQNTFLGSAGQAALLVVSDGTSAGAEASTLKAANTTVDAVPVTGAGISNAITDMEASGMSQIQGGAMNNFFSRAAQSATHNPGSDEVILGQYIEGSSNSYDAVAESRGATYFSMSNWTGMSEEVGSSQMWGVNQAFLDQQMAQGKNFIFTSDPSSAPIGSFTSREYNYLLFKGYDVVPDSGGMFRAIK